jgi:hypothetical protein
LLRLELTESLPWVDSRNTVRSPFEEFRCIERSASDALDSGTLGTYALWNIGVLTDESEDAPDSSKPTLFGEESSDANKIGFAVGHSQAQRLFQRLVPLWSRFIDDMTLSYPTVYLVSDRWRGPNREWLDLGAAALAGALGPVGSQIRATNRSLTFSARLNQSQLRDLLSYWWPAAGGFLAGVVLRNHDEEVAQRIARAGLVPSADLTNIRHVFQTTPSFDDLGFAVLSRGTTWNDMRSLLNNAGWRDAQPLDDSLQEETS